MAFKKGDIVVIMRLDGADEMFISLYAKARLIRQTSLLSSGKIWQADFTGQNNPEGSYATENGGRWLVEESQLMSRDEFVKLTSHIYKE